MLNPEVFLLGLALAIDAGVVTFAFGLLNHDATRAQKLSRGLIVSLVFGFFQFLMLWLGSYGGFLFSFSNYGHMYQLVVAMIFFMIALKFIHESIEIEKREINWGLWPLIVLGVATSIDALASGVSFGTLPLAYLIALDIGLITFIVCGIFYLISQFFKRIPEKWLLRMGAMIFLILGGNIVWEYVFKGAV